MSCAALWTSAIIVYPACADYDQAVIDELVEEWEDNERYLSTHLKAGAGTPPEIDLEGEDMLLTVLYNLVTVLNLREDAGQLLGTTTSNIRKATGSTDMWCASSTPSTMSYIDGHKF